MKSVKIAYTIKEQVYNELKNAILSGHYKPGEWLQEVSLAKALQVSRSPVREALQQLIGDGLAVNIPNKGVFVRAFTSRDMADIFEVRQSFEEIGIRRSPDWLNSQRIQMLVDMKNHLVQNYNNKDKAGYIVVDTELHKCILDMSGNSLIKELSIRIYTIENLSRSISLYDDQRFYESVEEHAALVDYIIAGRIPEALEVHRRHLQLAKQVCINQVGKLQITGNSL